MSKDSTYEWVYYKKGIPFPSDPGGFFMYKVDNEGRHLKTVCRFRVKQPIKKQITIRSLLKQL